MSPSARSLSSTPAVRWALVVLASATLGAGVGVAAFDRPADKPAPVVVQQSADKAVARPAAPAASRPASVVRVKVAPTEQRFTATFVAATADSITVQGVGNVEGTPDVAIVSLEVAVVRKTSGEAMDAANSVVSKVFASLRHHGVAAADIQSTGLSLYATYDYAEHQPPTLSGYRAGQTISAKLRAAKTRGAAISAAVSASPGDVSISGLSYDIQHDAAFLTTAQKRAFVAARKKAKQYAELAHRKLGRVMTIKETTTPGSAPFPYADGGAMGDSPGAAADVPLASGTQTVGVSVTVTWALAG